MDDIEFCNKIKEMRADKTTGLQKMREFLKQPGHLDRLFDLAIKGAGKPKKPPKNKARSSLPDAFPDQALLDVAKGFWALSKRQDLVADVQGQAEHFRDHHIGAGTLAADWPATWRTWMRKALKFNRVPWGQPTSAVAATRVEDWRWRVKIFHQGDPENGIDPGYWKDGWGPKPGEPGCQAPQ